MNSFAIGLKPRDSLYLKKEGQDTAKIEKCDGENLNIPIEFHANIWKMPTYVTTSKPKNYIDIGIKASFIYDKIKIFLPFSICETFGCVDLIDKIRGKRVINALFNSECIVTQDKDSCFSKVTQYDRRIEDESRQEKTFFLYPIGEKNYTLSNNFTKNNDKTVRDGTWLEISIIDFPSEIKYKLEEESRNDSNLPGHPGTDICKKYDGKYYSAKVLGNLWFYIRFRILIKDSSEFIISRNLSNDFLQSAFSKIELYDLRFNEVRNIDEKVREEIEPKKYILARFLEAHIFFVGSSKVQIDNGSIIKTDSRIIEPEIWADYEPPHNPDSIFIAHHWKINSTQNLYQDGQTDTDKVKNKGKVAFDIFFSAICPKFHIWTVILYISVIVLLGTLGSFLSTGIIDTKQPEQSWYLSITYKGWIIILMCTYITAWILQYFRMTVKTWWAEK